MTNLACAIHAPLSPKEYDNILALAWEKGSLAGIQAVPSPMHLVASDIWGRPLPGARVDVISEGPCGFAWVNIRPATSAFARWLKKHGHASAAYGGGLTIRIHDFNQSMERKEACAHAMAQVFQNAGINAYAGSRMD
jgi:hypothetical protein